MSTSQREYYVGLERASRALAGPEAAPAARAHAVHATLDGGDDARIACRSGCAHCCHFPVGARFEEVVRLREAIDDDQPLRAQVEREADATRNAGWHELAGRPCPMLDDGACARYAQRPTPCRALLSFDAEACERSLHEPTAVPRDEVAWWRGLGAAAALDGPGEAATGPRELRSALAALLRLPGDASLEQLRAAFAAARPVPGTDDATRDG